MENKRFVKCDICGKKIYLGTKAFRQRGLCGIYCSSACYAAAFATESTISLAVADDCCKTVYEERVTIEDVPLSQDQIERELTTEPEE